MTVHSLQKVDSINDAFEFGFSKDAANSFGHRADLDENLLCAFQKFGIDSDSRQLLPEPIVGLTFNYFKHDEFNIFTTRYSLALQNNISNGGFLTGMFQKLGDDNRVFSYDGTTSVLTTTQNGENRVFCSTIFEYPRPDFKQQPRFPIIDISISTIPIRGSGHRRNETIETIMHHGDLRELVGGSIIEQYKIY